MTRRPNAPALILAKPEDRAGDPGSPGAIADRLDWHRRQHALCEAYRTALGRAVGRHGGAIAASLGGAEAGIAAITAAMSAALSTARNPYGQLVAALAAGDSPQERAARQGILTELRPLLTTTFAYAVPSDQALDRIAQLGDEILEIGAGGGYWARCLAARGITVQAFDRLLPPRQRRKAGSLATHFPIRVGGAPEALAACPHYPTLLLCWPPGIANRAETDAGAPPRFSPMGEQALDGFAGRQLVFVGARSASFGSPAFFTRLTTEWQQSEHLPLPNLGSWRDSVYIYRRR